MDCSAAEITEIAGMENSNEEWTRIVPKEQLFSKIKVGRSKWQRIQPEPVNSRDLRKFTGSGWLASKMFIDQNIEFTAQGPMSTGHSSSLKTLI
jgi:hypothetical protein